MGPEDRALQRDLLLARAALERAQLLLQLDTLSPPGKPLGVASGLSRLAQGSLRSDTWVTLGLSALQLVRRHPVLVPTLVTASRLVRGRVGRLVLLAGVVGAVAWAMQRRSRGTEVAADHEVAADPEDTPIY